MKDNLIFKILCSYPVILITLFFMPVIGIILIFFRFYMYRDRIFRIPITILIVGLVLLIPKLLDYIFDLIKFDSSKIPYFDTVVDSPIYDRLIGFSKFIIAASIIILIVSFIVKNIASKLDVKAEQAVRNYVERQEAKELEIHEKNDLLVKKRASEANNTHVVKCPSCGGYNTLVYNTGTCKYCRRKIQYKE